jgi:hypothetical protein
LEGKAPPPEFDVILEIEAEAKDMNKDELLRDLEAADINSKGNIPVLKECCGQADIPLTKTLDRLTPGYVGKPKAALQIAYKRGFINANKKNADGKIVSWEETIVKDCNDCNRANNGSGPRYRDQHLGRSRKKPKKK